jgi:hypothetical protein
MRARLLALVLLPAFLLPAAPKKIVGTARGENEDVILTVTLYVDPTAVKEAVGNDLEGHYVVANVKFEPKYGKEVAIDRDDFLLRTDRDGERTRPYAPSQIAGRGALVIAKGSGGGGGGGIESGPPGYPDGYPGGYPGGYPPMGGPPLMGPGGSVGGGGGGAPSDVQAKVESGAGEKPNPLKKTLEEKILPEKKTTQAVSGLLYFPLEKQKLKDLELYYGGREDRIRMRFKEEK